MRIPLFVALAAVLLFLTGTVAFVHRYVEEFIETERMVSHTDEVILEISGTFRHVRDAESAARGFALTEDENFLEYFPAQRGAILDATNRLRKVTGDDPAQQARLDRLAPILVERVRHWDDMIRRRRTEGLAAAAEQAVLGRPLSDQIRTILVEMEDEERLLLRRRIEEAKQSALRMKVLSTTLAAAAGGIFVAIFFVSNHFLVSRRRAELELDRFFETSLDLMCIADLGSGRFVRVSPSWEKTLGWTVGEATSRPWLEFVHPDDIASTVGAAEGLARGEAVITFENRYRCRDGSHRWLSWKVPAPAPGSSLVCCGARDVTDLKRTTEQIRRLNADLAGKVEETLAANKELEAFSYSVSHDLRAPLRAIDGFSRLALEEYGGVLGAEGNRLLNVVRSSTQKMGQLIDDLLQFSRLGRQELEMTQVEMTDLARDAVEEHRRDDPSRAVEVRIDPLPRIRGDRALLRQVWANLVSNAYKYSRLNSAARIEIGADRVNGEEVYRVRDNGVGFDMQYADKLFGVFQRLHSKKEFEGTGVGLAIVQRVIQRHHGRVWADSRLGEGATFYFAIPALKG
jgi:PAS domain S-box-containing protein